mgnify:CR=1 FL=1
MNQPVPRESAPNEPMKAEPPREPVFNIAPVIFAAIIACVGVHALRELVLASRVDVNLIWSYAFVPLRLMSYPFDIMTWFSAVSYSFLHSDWMHVGVNMVWLAAFASPLAVRIGAVRTILFWMFTAMISALVHAAVEPYSPYPLVGASGAVSGFVAAAARFGFQVDRSRRLRGFAGRRLGLREIVANRTVLLFIVIWMVGNWLTGSGVLDVDGGRSIAWEAHVGGFVAGFFGLFLFDSKT